MVAAPLLVAAIALALACCPWRVAHADELDDVRAELKEKVAQADELADELKSAQDEVERLQDEIDELLDGISDKQAQRSQLQAHGADVVKSMYKNSGDLNLLFMFSEAESLEEVLMRLEMRERVIAEYNNTLHEVQAAQDELQADYDRASEAKSKQVELVSDMQAKQKELEKVIAELREREASLDAEQQAALAQASAAAHKVPETFATGTVNADAGEWHTGMASAYGGASDSMTPNPSSTATGTLCDDWSVGVAVPLSWGPSDYYGKMVEISYGGRSIIAPIVDCGGMDGVVRHLDLQPGVFKAFGCNTCSDWGVREVRYRFL